jgi:Mg-chelatase subunit ChlD
MGAIRDDPAVPALIEALAVWISRRERGEGSRRIESELMRELERRSGRRIGAHPERWTAWWKTKSAAGATAQVTDEPRPRTHAGFFGLRPVTDRVVFVIDRSGSMSGAFGAGENTRYGEAIAQMLAFLRELGPTTRFRVVLFSTDTVVWKDRLQPANEGNLRAVERWLRYHPPAGATNLKPAVEHVFRLDGNGRAGVERIEEDSVVVLCDGVTASGSAWVRPLLERTNDDACLAFHCVQIGGRSDGTLETLAAESGGDYVTVTE